MTTWKKIQQLPWKDQRRLQDLKLAKFVREYLYPFHPYYRALFDKEKIRPEQIRSVADLARLPLTSKQDLLPTEEDPQQFKNFILQPDAASLKQAWPLSKKLPLLAQRLTRGPEVVKKQLRREFSPCFMSFTTGRSAEPMPFFYSLHDLDNLHETGSRLVEVLGLEQEFRIANLFPYAPHLAFWQVVFAGLETGMMVLSTGGGRVMGSSGDLRAIARTKADAILGVPGYIYHLLRRGAAEGHDLSSVKTVVLGAERVPPGMKNKIRAMLSEMGANDVQVFGTYGFTEARMAFAECPTGDPEIYSGYHLYPDLAIFEVIDPKTGEVLPEGESGELVITPLDGRASMVFRYRTGDLVRGGIQYEPCPHCGRCVPRISSDLTRESSLKDLQTLKVKGTLVNLEDCAQILGNFSEIEEWQIELCKKDNDPMEVDEIVVRLALQEDACEQETIKKIKESFKGRIEVSPNRVEFFDLPDMLEKIGMESEMKEKRFVDSRPEL
ncbi:MAG: phenylacetate--CoA ligase family protein [Planctomycetota bacterium]|jgi:phenylacetate-coenzyme A ligase PaaK-like adenylate-forming protein